MTDQKKSFQYIPIVAAVFTVAGLLLGKYLYQDGIQNPFSSFGSEGKVEEVISTVTNYYVDSVNQESLTDNAIREVLAQLDPHSTYLPAALVPKEKERMQGNFVGIGIEFRIVDDSLIVVWPIPGGPCANSGILAGDRLIGLDGKEVPLGTMTTDSLVSLLRGKAGSNVNIMVYRPSQKEVLNFDVVRSEIPIYSIDASFLINSNIGFVKINRFSKKTHLEFVKATNDLIEKGAKKLIIDVRDNPGGSLKAVKDVCNELLEENREILSTKGNNEFEKFEADGSGRYQKIELAILINERSASASEILAGAIQDNDRGIIIGRRTFGKGLVQNVIPLQDNSRINLTVARYYMPSGRCIQKPFEKNHLDKYRHESIERGESGELYHEMKKEFPDSLKFKTLKGRTVIAQNGINPDYFVPIDTSFNSEFLFALAEKDLIRDFIVKHYSSSASKDTLLSAYLGGINDQQLGEKFKLFVDENEIEWQEKEWQESKKFIILRMRAYIARGKFGGSGFYEVISSDDHEVIKAIELFK